MEVTVIKFERHIDMQKVSVTFSIIKTDTGFATIMAGLVDLVGTDEEMVSAAWNSLQDSITYWLSTEKQIIGKKFTVSISPSINQQSDTTVPQSDTTVQQTEIVNETSNASNISNVLSSTDHTNTE